MLLMLLLNNTFSFYILRMWWESKNNPVKIQKKISQVFYIFLLCIQKQSIGKIISIVQV